MREHPILFNSEMVKAILDGRKTQTRRIVKNPGQYDGLMLCGEESMFCPYGGIGDRLWVKETFRSFLDGDTYYRADFGDNIPVHSNDGPEDWKWQPSIFMPRDTSRITLEIINVRMDKVKEISETDALAEGVIPGIKCCNSAVCAFGRLWDSINLKRGYGWETNPLVWVIEFKAL